ncbi:MAG: hypothetical protein QXR09_00430 [Candidatus Aenigmatarchaeota archaeon]
MKRNVGEYAFLLGIGLAVVAGLLMQTGGWISVLLVLLGLVVGLMNITSKETISFLLAAVALLIVGSAGLEKIPIFGVYLEPIIANIQAFVAPAVVVVALKTIFDLAKKK